MYKVLLSNLSKVYFLMVCLIPSIGLNYFLLWKNDKYLTYFKEFEQESKEVKRKWAWISFGVVVGIILLLIVSFWIMTEAIN
jgi:preprotein translocase subunit SecE